MFKSVPYSSFKALCILAGSISVTAKQQALEWTGLIWPHHASTCLNLHCEAKLGGFNDVLQSLKVLLQRLHRQKQCDDPAGSPLRHKYLGNWTKIMQDHYMQLAAVSDVTISSDRVSRFILLHGPQ